MPHLPSNTRPVALVTGAARRLGRAIALELAAAGFDVAAHCREPIGHADETLAALRERGVRAEAFTADLADEAACTALVPAVAARLGRVDVVVNNASVFDYDAVGTFTGAALARHMSVNVAAPVLLAQALHAHLLDRDDDGCVVNILDQKLWNPNPDYLSYTLSKAALESATTLLALALAPRLRVCGVAPGVTLVSGPMTPAEFSAAHTLTPLNRSSTPHDIARAVRFLVESPAVTGTTLLVDGGQHLTGQRRDVLFLAQQAAATPLAVGATG